ncbi:MAG: hypothetical protein V3V14_07930 [Saprospiraceae bacterium]
MYKFLIKKGPTLALGLGATVIAIYLISIYSGFNGGPYDMSTDLAKLSDTQLADVTYFDSGIKITVLLVSIAFLLAFVVFGIRSLIMYPKSAIKFLVGFLALAGVFFALYSMADVETIGSLGMSHEKFNITDNISKFISGGIKTTLGLLVLSVLAVIGGELYSAVK